jgi:hypothetical protein
MLADKLNTRKREEQIATYALLLKMPDSGRQTRAIAAYQG